MFSFFGRPADDLLASQLGQSHILQTFAWPVSGTGLDRGHTPIGFALDRHTPYEHEWQSVSRKAPAAGEAEVSLPDSGEEALADALQTCRALDRESLNWAHSEAQRHRSSLEAVEAIRGRSHAADGARREPRSAAAGAVLAQAEMGLPKGSRCAAYGILWGKGEEYIAPQLEVIQSLLARFGPGAEVDTTWGGGVEPLVADEEAAARGDVRWLQEPSTSAPSAGPPAIRAARATLRGRLCLLSSAASGRAGGGFARRGDVGQRTLQSVEGLHFVGRVSSAQWRELLDGACFLVGSGRPLAGPSAIEAMSRGALYINPVFPSLAVRRLATEKPPFENSRTLEGYLSQHPAAAALPAEPSDPVGIARACNVSMSDAGTIGAASLVRCVTRALLHGRCRVDVESRASASGARDENATLTAESKQANADGEGARTRFSDQGPSAWFTREAHLRRVAALVEGL